MKKLLIFSLVLFTGVLCIAAGNFFNPEHVASAIQPLSYLPHCAIAVAAVDSTRSRAAYQRIMDICIAIAQKLPGQGGGDIIVNRDFILSEQVIQNNVSTYIFDLWNKTLINQTPKRPLVKGVVDNDLFMACNVRLLIDSRTIEQSNVKVQSFPVEAAFAGSGATTDDLWSIYNAQWFLQVDRVVYVPGDTTRKLLFVPPFNLSDNGGLITEPVNTIDGCRYYPLDPYPIISGRLDNKLTLEVDLYAGWNGAADQEVYADTENVISFEFDGYTIKNGHKFIQFFNGSLDINSPEDVKAFRGNN